MARNVGLVVSWTGTQPGREGKALESFTDFITFWAKRAADGKNEEAETYFAADGSKGFAVIRGTSESVRDAFESDEYEMLLTKAQLTVRDLRSELYYAGDEETQRAITMFGTAAGELGYL